MEFLFYWWTTEDLRLAISPKSETAALPRSALIAPYGRNHRHSTSLFAFRLKAYLASDLFDSSIINPK